MTALDKSQRYVLLEQSIFTDIPGEPEGAPFLVTIDRESQQVFSVYRIGENRTRKDIAAAAGCITISFQGLMGFMALGCCMRWAALPNRCLETFALLDAAMLAN